MYFKRRNSVGPLGLGIVVALLAELAERIKILLKLYCYKPAKSGTGRKRRRTKNLPSLSLGMDFPTVDVQQLA